MLFLATKVVKSLNANLVRGRRSLQNAAVAPEVSCDSPRPATIFPAAFQLLQIGAFHQQIRLIPGPEIAAEQLRLSGDTQSKGCDVELANQANHVRPQSQINHIQASRLTWLSSISALCSTLHPEGRFFFFLSLLLSLLQPFQRYVLALTQIIGIKSLNVTASAHL